MAQTEAGGVTYDATREVRFAVVLYGGVSLAIYINGVVRELLNLVWATAPAPARQGRGKLHRPEPEPDVVNVYRELGRRLDDGGRLRRDDGGPVRTRFVVDIIAGASAGGINGVCLAKALACDLDLRQLDALWVDQADIGKLVNDRGSRTVGVAEEQPPEALLSGRRMQYLLLDALRRMNGTNGTDGTNGTNGQADGPAGTSPSPYADAIDLFVTATDLNGRSEEVMLTDGPTGPVQEVVHRTVFHFMYGKQDTIGGDEGTINQFTPAYDPMLAFAARATASFPGAFSPTCLNDLDDVLGAVYQTGRAGIEEPESDVLRRFFFSRYGDDYREVCFADGGYLDNKPFEPVLDALPHRRADLQVDRKVLYVEPDPSLAPGGGLVGCAGKDDSCRPSLLDTVIKVATIPRVETIGNDVNHIRSFGELGTARRAVYDEITRALDGVIDAPDDGPAGSSTGIVQGLEVEGPPPAGGSGGLASKTRTAVDQAEQVIADLDLRMRELQAPTHAAYRQLRVARTLRDLGEVLARIVPDKVHDPGSAMHADLVQAARVWYEAEGPDPDRFLGSYDLRFALDRINFVQGRVRDRQHGTPEDVADDQPLLGELDEAYATLRGRGRAIRLPCADNPARAQIDDFRRQLEQVQKSQAKEKNQDGQRSVAEIVRTSTDVRNAFDAVAMAIRDHLDLGPTGERDRQRLLAHRDRTRLLRDWTCFELYDEAIGPLRDELPGENDSIEVHRLSPYDTSAIVADPESTPKLAGAAIHHFGGFFHEDWRRNDILWGRLDTAERMITVLAANAPAEERNRLIRRAHLAILRELYGDTTNGWRTWLRDRFPQIDRVSEDERPVDLLERLQDEPRVATSPDRIESVVLGARAARVASRVVDHLGKPPRAVPGARTAGWVFRLAANVVELLIPGRLKTLLWQRMLVLVIVAAGLTATAGFLLRLDQVRSFGLVTLGAALGVRLVSDVAVGRIEGITPGWVTWLARTAIGVLIVLGFLGGNAIAQRDDGWQYVLVGLVPAVVVMLVVPWMAWRRRGGVGPARLAVILLLAAAVTLTVVAVADWDTTWSAFQTLVGTS